MSIDSFDSLDSPVATGACAAREREGVRYCRQVPTIVVNSRQQEEIAHDAWSAVVEANEPPTIFALPRGLTLVAREATGGLYSTPATKERLAHALRRSANWVQVAMVRNTGKIVTNAVNVPAWLPADMLVDPNAAERLPLLRTIVGCPVVTPAGSLIATPGYDRESGIYLDAPSLPVPEHATQDQARAALGRLLAPFEEFPYATAGDLANAAALLLTPFLRPAIAGPAPMAVVEAPTQGTGKTLLASSLLRITTPRLVLQSLDDRERGNDEELGKTLGATLASSPAAVLLDNLRGVIASSTLEAILTAPDGLVEVRQLGTSTNLKLDVSGLTLAATANNLSLGRDMVRRSYFIRLDAGVEQPELRRDFRIANLDAHIRENRERFLADALILLRAWIDAGMPMGTATKGSFERWAALLSGVLAFAGVDGFLTSDRDRGEAANPETIAWRSFVAAWWDRYQGAPQCARDLVDLAVAHEIVMDHPGAARSLSKKLQAARDRVFGDSRIVSLPGSESTLRFALHRKPPTS